MATDILRNKIASFTCNINKVNNRDFISKRNISIMPLSISYMILTVMARCICKPSKQQNHEMSPDWTKSTIFCNSALSYWCRFVEIVLNLKAVWNLPMTSSVARMKSLSVRRQLLTDSDLTEKVAVRIAMIITSTSKTSPIQAQAFRNMVLTSTMHVGHNDSYQWCLNYYPVSS